MNDEDPSTLSEFWEDLEFGFISTLWGRTALGSSDPVAAPGRQQRAV